MPKRKPSRAADKLRPIVRRQVGYGLVLKRAEDGYRWLAWGATDQPFFARLRSQAVAFRDSLAPHINQVGKIVRVEYTYREVPPNIAPHGRDERSVP